MSEELATLPQFLEAMARLPTPSSTPGTIHYIGMNDEELQVWMEVTRLLKDRNTGL